MSDEEKDATTSKEAEAAEKVLGDEGGVYIPQGEDGQTPPKREISIDFGGFVVGLYQSAMVSLGEMEHPETGESSPDLESARHTIDILRMLQQKTEGNLDEEEDQLLRGLLYKLRMAFVEAKE